MKMKDGNVRKPVMFLRNRHRLQIWWTRGMESSQ